MYLGGISTFLAACGETAFSSGILVSTTAKWGNNVESALKERDKPIARWGPAIFENSSIDWEKFSLDNPSDIKRRETKTLRDYQETASQEVLQGFITNDRGKMIMACGTGKTFTALRIAEELTGPEKLVLFLTPVNIPTVSVPH